MGWIRRELANDLYWRQPDWQVDVESSGMREEIGLRYYLQAGDEHMAQEELGRRIDDCLVEYISTYLPSLRLGDISIEEFKSRMDEIEEGMGGDQALRAFEVAIRSKIEARPASRTYLKLARRHLQRKTNEGSSYSRRLPDPKEGRQFARVMLDEVMIKAKWKHDWDREFLIRSEANDWLRKRDEYGLWKLILASEKSAIAWDTLELICRNLVDRGEGERPARLLQWSFDTWGRLKRPDEDPVRRQRQPRVGYKLRNNEIHHIVDLLVRVGISRTAACEAVVEAFWDSEGALEFVTISRICLEPYWAIGKLESSVMEFLGPSYHKYVHTAAAEDRFLKDMIAEFVDAGDSGSDDDPLLPLPPLPSSKARFDQELWEEGPHGRKYIGGGSREEHLDALHRALPGKQW